MKRKWLSLFFMLFVVMASGCSDGEKNHSNFSSEDEIVSMDAPGQVYNIDPGASIYETVYGNSPVETVIADVEQRDPYATYLLGTLYFTGNPRHGLEKNPEKGVGLLKNAWSMGVVDAGYSLYQVYGQGLGVEKNDDLATRYLKYSADMGLLLSQRELAKDYFGRSSNDYFVTDYQQAKVWYARAAEQGDRESAIALAKIYHEGLGVDVNDELAFEWASRSEDMEYGTESLSISALSWCYEEGIGTDVDLVQAYKYYDLMGTAGIPDKERLSEKMTPEQVQEAIRLSGEWQREHNISMPNSEGYHYR